MSTASPSTRRKGQPSATSKEDVSENKAASRSSALDSDPESSGKKGAGKGLTYSKSVVDKERKIGHRRVDDAGKVSYKKVSTNQLMGSIQLGIQNSIGVMSKHAERDLLMQDFMTVETVVFNHNGTQTTPAHPYSDFTFRTFAPLAFRYFLHLFGIRREDFMLSICSEEMRELSNPGASGSIFYLTHDDEFILKTVQHKEAEFLQKLLPGYYMNLNQNPHTLLPKFFGMFTYQCNQKNIRLTVMNNLLPSKVKMHLKFDLKGSTYKRKASRHERAKKSPTFKDLDFMEILPEGVLLEPETYNALISTLRRDCRVLESFRIMDYSLLVGIHNLDLAAREDSDADASSSPVGLRAKREAHRLSSLQQPKKLASTCMESIQAQTEPIDEQEHLPPGGIPARNHKGERLLLFLGIIDILQSYRMRKKLEHTLKAIIHDGDTVSVHRPGFYAHRFLDFMADRVFKKIPSLDLPEIKGSHRKFRTIVSSLIGVGQQYQSSALKHSPSKKSKRDSVKKASTVSAAHVASKLQDVSAGMATATAAMGASAVAALATDDNAESQKANGGVAVGYQSPYNKPDVIAGHMMSSSSSSMAPNTSSLGRAKNRVHEQIKQSSGEAGDRNSESRMSGEEHGTPSHLSVGAGSMDRDWNTPTWTEGTPSFTESTCSGDVTHLGQSPVPCSSDQITAQSNITPLTLDHCLETPRTETSEPAEKAS